MSYLLVVLALVAPDLSGILKLSDDSGNAHACPIAMDKALTNKHVVAGETEMVWGTGDGEDHHGLVKIDWQDSFRDLAYVVPVSVQRFPKWYSIAEKPPAIGEKVWFQGYDFRSKKDAYAPREFPAKVVRIFNGMLVYDPDGRPGSSGSCVLNEAGEVVGINQGATPIEGKPETERVGVAIGVWGSWLLLRKDEPTVEEPVFVESHE